MIKKVFQNRGKMDYLINRNEIMVSHLENKYNWTFLSLKKMRENKKKITTSCLFQRSIENSPLVKGPPPSLCCSEFPIASFLIVSWDLRVNRSFPGGASGKEPACQCGRLKRCGFDP